MRLISVVMGEDSTDKRSADTLAMLDYGFNTYQLDAPDDEWAEKIIKRAEEIRNKSDEFLKK